MTAQGVGQLYYPSCLIPTPPPPIPVNDFLSDAPFGDLENFPMVGFKVRQWVWFVWYLVNVCHTDQTSCLQAVMYFLLLAVVCLQDQSPLVHPA